MRTVTTKGIWFIHAHAICDQCDFEISSPKTGRREAKKHCQETGHTVTLETGYSETFTNKDVLCKQ